MAEAKLVVTARVGGGAATVGEAKKDVVEVMLSRTSLESGAQIKDDVEEGVVVKMLVEGN